MEFIINFDTVISVIIISLFTNLLIWFSYVVSWLLRSLADHLINKMQTFAKKHFKKEDSTNE